MTARTLALFFAALAGAAPHVLGGNHWRGTLEKGQYCGVQSCYDVLGLERRSDLTDREVKKAYRKLAITMHPDKVRTKNAGEIKAANDAFTVVTAANNALKTKQKRLNYNHYLDHPEDRGNDWDDVVRRYAAKSNVWVVLFVFFSILSVILWIVQKQRYSTALRYFRRKADVVMQAKNAVIERKQQAAAGKSLNGSGKKKGGRREAFTASSAEIEAMLDEMFKTVDISGGYREPVLFAWVEGSRLPDTDILLLRMVTHWPIAICTFCYWAIRWVVLFWVLKRDYGHGERMYLTRSALGAKPAKWAKMGENQPDRVKALVAMELWTPAGMASYVKEQEEEFKRKNPAQWKRMQRWKRKGN